MRLSGFVERIGGEGAVAWDLHTKGMAAARAGEDVIVLSVGDSELATPAPVTEAAVEALHGGDTHYTSVEGRPELRRAIAERFAAGSGLATGPGNVIVLAGAQNALFASLLCLAGPGDEVIALEPMYVTYEASIRASGAELARVAQPAAGGFRPDPAAIEAAVTPRTRALCITTPNNPTGVAMIRDELEAIAGIAKRHDLWVVSDEVYADLVFDGSHVSIAALPGMAERTVTLSSLSKSHAMTGWRTGWAIGPEALIGHMGNLSLCMLYGLPGFVQAAGVAALTVGLPHIEEIRNVFRRRRDLAHGLLSRVDGLEADRPAGGMFLMADIRGLGMTGAAFAEALYEAERVTVLDATAFGPSAEGFLRISFAVAEAQIEEGCRRIARFVAGLGG